MAKLKWSTVKKVIFKVVKYLFTSEYIGEAKDPDEHECKCGCKHNDDEEST